MQTNRLILGIYLHPSLWICDESEHIDPKLISREECLEVVFTKTLQNGIEVCIQRQGFIVVAFPESLLNTNISKINTNNLLPIKAAQFSISFFNALLFLIYDQTYKHHNGRFQSIKQAIGISEIWKWLDDPSSELRDIAIQQPAPIMKQDEMLSLDNVPHLFSKTIGNLTEVSKLFRMHLPIHILDQALDTMFIEGGAEINWQLLSLLNKAVFITQKAEFEESLVISWSVAEILIGIEWENYISQTNRDVGATGEKTVNSKRLDKLTSSNFDVSHRVEILELAKVIPYELYKRSLNARTSRNNRLHYLKPVTQEESRNCFLLARDLLSRKMEISIDHPGAVYLHDEYMTHKP